MIDLKLEQALVILTIFEDDEVYYVCIIAHLFTPQFPGNIDYL